MTQKLTGGRAEQYTKEINTPRKNANVVITIYPSSTAVARAGPVRGVGWKTWRGMGGSIAGSVVVAAAAAVAVQSQKGHPWRRGWSRPSEGSHE